MSLKTVDWAKRYSELSGDEIREQMMNMTIREILERRLVSKEWRDIIDEDSFWCRLIKRDYNEDKSDNCKMQYREMGNVYYHIAKEMHLHAGTDISYNISVLENAGKTIIDEYLKYIKNFMDEVISNNDRKMNWKDMLIFMIENPEHNINIDTWFMGLYENIVDFVDNEHFHDYVMSKLFGFGPDYRTIYALLDRKEDITKMKSITKKLIQTYVEEVKKYLYSNK
jgi:hypothetical protein